MMLILQPGNRHNQDPLDRLAQQYYQRIRFYFSFSLDRDVEVEEMTRAKFRVETVVPDPKSLHGVDHLLVSIGGKLLHYRWLGSCCGELYRSEVCFEELEDQAAILYIKFRTLRSNSVASIEISASIHHWIGRNADARPLTSGPGMYCMAAGCNHA